MKTKTKFAVALVAAAAMSMGAVAVAQVGPGPEGRFDEADVDGDGALTLDEFTSAHTRRFESADADGDGTVTPEEFGAAISARIRERGEERIAEFEARRGGAEHEGRGPGGYGGHGPQRPEDMDANGDGAVDIVEFEESVAGQFASLDADGDGVLTRDEARPPMGPRGHGGGDCGPRD